MAHQRKRRAAIKFTFWLIVAIVSIGYVAKAHYSGKLAAWYYYEASSDGFAINADSFQDASKTNPARLAIKKTDTIDGLIAVPVKKGDRMPFHANGVISEKELKKGKRATLADATLTVLVPWEIQESKGFKFKDTFKHKGVETYPWAAVWNVVMVMLLGLSLGYMAEGLTDLLGIKIEKIRHFEGH
jgi:hypothetical protein